jgi:hypothetical protein
MRVSEKLDWKGLIKKKVSQSHGRKSLVGYKQFEQQLFL